MSHTLITAVFPGGEVPLLTASFGSQDIPVATAQADFPEDLVPDDLAVTCFSETGVQTHLTTDENGDVVASDDGGAEYILDVVANAIPCTDENNQPSQLNLVVV